ncbi:hypothetical protein [Bacillus sp. M6-12]|uniref:hypothetical protein n=1 Tax=Bacillus sp. M6-12 TaxID=2054166 RepID=UPI0015E0E619|nr:hypothetical protein [Bacillus sp. M6-12]
MGFAAKYKNVNFPVGAKMLVYLTEQQLIMGVNTVKGSWKDGQIYPSSSGYPLKLPIYMDYEVQKDGLGITLKEVQRVVPIFHPHKDLSFFPINEEQYVTLEKMLIDKNH